MTFATPEMFREHAFDPTRDGDNRPTFIEVPSVANPGGCLHLAISREGASQYFETKLFTGTIVTVSATAWDADHHKARVDVPELLAYLHRLLGPEAPPTFRAVNLGTMSASYFYALIGEAGFTQPTPLQEAFLERNYNGRALLPA